jgi:hypothetical protein
MVAAVVGVAEVPLCLTTHPDPLLLLVVGVVACLRCVCCVLKAAMACGG